MDKRVGLWVRIGDAEEVLVGFCRSVSDMPHLLDALAQELRQHMAPDVFETSMPKTPSPDA